MGTILTSCSIPSGITCNEMIPRSCPWYIRVYPKEKTKNDEKENNRKEKKITEIKKQNKNKHAK